MKLFAVRIRHDLRKKAAAPGIVQRFPWAHGALTALLAGAVPAAAWAEEGAMQSRVQPQVQPKVQSRSRPQLDLPRVELRVGVHRIEAQVAATALARQVGLMHRVQMPAHEGMLFVFEQAAVQCFWMKDTLLPLTAAFVADDGTVVNLADMQPLDEAAHCSARPVRFVLEMHQGWFAKRGLAAGSKLGGEVFAGR